MIPPLFPLGWLTDYAKKQHEMRLPAKFVERPLPPYLLLFLLLLSLLLKAS